VLQRRLGSDKVALEQDSRYGVPWLERSSRWDVGLATGVPLELRIDVGASRSVLDLRELRLRRLDLKTGASETRIILPRAAGVDDDRRFAGCGALTVEVPAGVAVRFRSRMGLGSVNVDQSRFPPSRAATPPLTTTRRRTASRSTRRRRRLREAHRNVLRRTSRGRSGREAPFCSRAWRNLNRSGHHFVANLVV
jgi:hypothetical protein